MRRVHDVGVDLLRDQRQAGLLPRQPGRAVRDRGRGGDDLRVGVELAVALGVGPLADDREVGARLGQRPDEPVDVTTDPAPVGGDRCGVEQDAWSRPSGGQGLLLRECRA